MKICIKCEQEIPSGNRSEKYCSLRCSRLFLKSQWRKAHRDSQNAYNREYRKLGKRHLTSDKRKRILERIGAACERCASVEGLHIHHIKPLRLGGTNNERNLMVFCDVCHQEWHKVFDNSFWEKK